jgi:hypothetical protein
MVWFCLSLVTLVAGTIFVTSSPTFTSLSNRLKFEVTVQAPFNASLLLAVLFFAMGVYRAYRELHAIFRRAMRLAQSGRSVPQRRE